MTLKYPDVSNFQGNMALTAGTPACIAKASEGTTYKDLYYAHFKAEAARVGAVFGAYHFLHAGNASAQAANCFAAVGRDVPLMVDVEPTAGSNPMLSDLVAFRDAYRKLGGLVRLNYLPHWYWSGTMGSPSLAPVSDLALVSSSYTAYSDTGPGWASYGGLAPQVWQYTNVQPYSGQSVDFNAFRGTVAQFKALLGLVSPPPPPPPPPPIQETDMTHIISVTPDPTNPGGGGAGLFLVDGNRVSHIDTNEYAVQLVARYGGELTAAPADYEAHLSAMAVAQVTVDATALAASIAAAVKSALMDPALLAALGAAVAHAEAVQEHNETPAS
jgi:GH25 family lysozyme M1 (1,4-beta-N-acetylmuramidase)